MPQMAPISWLSLFMIFSITFMIFSIMNFYMYNPHMPNIHINKSFFDNKSLIWKW